MKQNNNLLVEFVRCQPLKGLQNAGAINVSVLEQAGFNFQPTDFFQS